MKRFFTRLAVALSLVAPAHAQVWLWSQTSTTNGNIDPSINWLEGMPPSAVDDSSRAEMAVISKWRDDSSGLVTLGGTSTAYTAATNQGNQSGLVSSLVPGYRLCFSPNVTNGTPATLTVDGQAAKPLRKAPNTALAGGELVVGTPYCATYFSSNGGEYIVNDYLNISAAITAGSITYAKIQNESNATILGNDSGAPAAPNELTLGTGLSFLTSTSVGIANSAITTALINNAAVTYAKIQNESNATVLGNDSGGAAAPNELTLGSGLSFLSSTSFGIATGALTSGMYAAGSVNTAAIGNSQVTYGKIQNESNATILGNDSGGAAAPGELTLSTGLSFLTSTSVGIPNNGITTALINGSAVTYAKIQNESNATLLGNDSGGAAAPGEITLGGSLAFTSATVVDAKVVSGTTVMSGGTSGQCLFNNSSVVSATFACASLTAADQTLSGGANVTSGSDAAGNLTIDCGLVPLQFQTNSAAFTLTAPTHDGSCMLLSTNTASAGTITFSGFTVGANTGDALDTVNTHKFIITIVRINGTATYMVKALQ